MTHLLHILRFAWPYLRKYKFRLFIGILAGLGFASSNAAVMLVVKIVFSRIVPQAQQASFNSAGLPSTGANVPGALSPLLDSWLPSRDHPLETRQIFGVILVFALAAGARSLLSYLSSYCMTWVSSHFISELRTRLLQKLYSLSLDFYQRSTVGDLTTRVVTDTQYLYNSISTVFADLIIQPATILAIVAVSLSIDWHLTVFAVIILPACMAPIMILGRRVRKAVHKNFSAAIAQSNLMIESLSGIRVVKSYHLEEENTRRFREHSDRIVQSNIKKAQAEGLINPFIEVTTSVAFAFLILYVVWARVTLPNMISVVLGVIMFFAPIRRLGQVHLVLQSGSVSADRLTAILNEVPSVLDSPSPVSLPPFGGSLEVKNLSFAYGTTTVLNDINLVVPKGNSLGIAGESGSGKSTLVNLLLRFYDPTTGAIQLDGIDIRQVRQQDLLSQIAMVSQEIVIFDTTLAENIGWGRMGATEAEIIEAAKRAQAHDFIMRFPDGYQTRPGERGMTLSGGQRQRIAIARAFVRNAPILILDEATASLDSQSEAEVQGAIDLLAENRTVITIAHRLSTLSRCHQIIVLQQGRIVETGSYSDLIKSGSIFASMAARQGIRA